MNKEENRIEILKAMHTIMTYMNNDTFSISEDNEGTVGNCAGHQLLLLKSLIDLSTM